MQMRRLALSRKVEAGAEAKRTLQVAGRLHRARAVVAVAAVADEAVCSRTVCQLGLLYLVWLRLTAR